MTRENLVVCVGELLIDFFCTDIDVDLTKGDHFLKGAGGAPANVTAAIAKLGGQAAFSGKVGKDPFGYFLKQTLDDVNVDTSMLVMDETAPTTLAFVSLRKNGERDFVFNRGADGLYSWQDVNLDVVQSAKLLHFGSATALLASPFRETYLRLMEVGHRNHQFISFDPNYRGDLWKGRQHEFIDFSKKAIALSDLVKVSDEELEMITGERDLKTGVSQLHAIGAKMVTVTLGQKGTYVSNQNDGAIVRSIAIESVDSTGAGDAFVGAVLYQFAKLDQPREQLREFERLKEIVAFANKVGALVCTKIGAIAALPTLQEVTAFK
jgi:fructokinase